MSERFDDFSRRLGATTSRRGVLKVIGAAIGAITLGNALRPLGASALACPGETNAGPKPCSSGTTPCGPCCCRSGIACVNYSQGICGCPSGTTPCGNACCRAGVACKSTGKSTCSGTGNVVSCTGVGQVCGNTCCAAGQTCCNGVCCASNQCCNNGTCGACSVCASATGATCVSSFTACPNNANCFCFQKTDSSPYCGTFHAQTVCDEINPECQTDADCTSTQACVLVNDPACCGNHIPTKICVDACSSGT